jgi:hypothetical protein
MIRTAISGWLKPKDKFYKVDPSRFETASAERSPGERELARGLVGEQLVEQGRFNHAMLTQRMNVTAVNRRRGPPPSTHSLSDVFSIQRTSGRGRGGRAPAVHSKRRKCCAR